MTLAVARHQWEEGARRLEAVDRDSRRYRQLHALVDAVLDELRRRVGQTFTLTQLADTYSGSEDWVRDVVVTNTPPKPEAGLRDTTLIQDAAFATYARAAQDYRP